MQTVLGCCIYILMLLVELSNWLLKDDLLLFEKTNMTRQKFES